MRKLWKLKEKIRSILKYPILFIEEGSVQTQTQINNGEIDMDIVICLNHIQPIGNSQIIRTQIFELIAKNPNINEFFDSCLMGPTTIKLYLKQKYCHISIRYELSICVNSYLASCGQWKWSSREEQNNYILGQISKHPNIRIFIVYLSVIYLKIY